MYLVQILSSILILILGFIITSNLSYKLPKYSAIFLSIVLGSIAFAALNYFFSLILGFPKGIIIGQITIFLCEAIYLLHKKPKFKFSEYLKPFLKEKYLLILLLMFGALLFSLFSTHIIPNINGDLYTGESTYGDLPFNLSTISQIAYGHIFPPQHPLYSGLPLAYPFLINFFSAIFVFEGMSLRNSILIPGIIFGLTMTALLYEFAIAVTGNKLKGLITAFLFLLNGGLGFYFFLKDYSFKIGSIFHALTNPTLMKEYSHLFSENIQWNNFLSRIIVPERSVLFGIPAGLIILQLLFFRKGAKLNKFEFLFICFLISLLPILHTHTFLVLAVVIPILVAHDLFIGFSIKKIKFYLIVAAVSFAMTIPHIPLFLNHIGETSTFFRLHLGWMVSDKESIFWFWFKNSYLYIPIALIALFIPKISTRNTKLLIFTGLILFVLINTFLFSPYDWDNIKILFWAGLFFSLAASELFVFLFNKKKFFINLICIIIIFTMVSSALLSLIRETKIKHVLFSKNDIKLGKEIRTQTAKNSTFLTYEIHNSPANNLGGRRILMGYPGLLWVHGINYSTRNEDIHKILQGSYDAKALLNEYKVNYVILQNNDPEGIKVDRDFFAQYPLFYNDNIYNVYKID